MKNKIVFTSLISLFVLLRLIIILTSVEKVSYSEELYRGAIAKTWLEGARYALNDLQPDPYSGGSVIEGMLAIPFFNALSPSLFALKMVPFLSSLATFILMLSFLYRFFNFKAAVLGGLLFLFAPPSFVQLSLVALGNHSESLLFSILMLAFFYPFLFQKPRPLFNLGAFGLVSGLGFYFANITFVTLLACLLSWTLMKPKSFLSWHLLVLAGFFLMGLLPWVAYNQSHNFEGLHFILEAFTFNNLFSPISLAKSIPFSFGFKPTFDIPWQVLAAAYAAIVFLALLKETWAYLVNRSEKIQKFLPFYIYLCLYLISFSLMNVEILGGDHFIGYRYWAPFHLFLILLMAVLLGEEKKSFFPVLALCILGMIGQSSLLFSEPFGKAFTYKGYCYSQLHQHLGIQKTRPQELNPYQEAGASLALSWLNAEFERTRLFKNRLSKVPESYHQDFFWGMGWFMGETYPSDPERARDGIFHFPPEARSQAFEGLKVFYQTLRVFIAIDEA